MGTIWSGTLTVQNLDAKHEGCSNGTTGKECSSTSVLTDDDFTLDEAARGWHGIDEGDDDKPDEGDPED